MVKKRAEISKKDCWNVEKLFASAEEWNKDFLDLKQDSKKHIEKLLSFRGSFGASIETIIECLDLYFLLDRTLTKLYTYAHLRFDEDVTNDQTKTMYGQILALVHDFNEKMSWLQPEILRIDPKFILDDKLIQYRVYLEKILRLKDHTLDAEKEQLIALSEKAMQGGIKIFSNFNNADLKFPKIKNGKGELKELTLGSLLHYLREQDPTLRKNAFEGVHAGYEAFENSLTEMINAQVQSHVFQTKARGYDSCLQAALYSHNINIDVYKSLIDAVHTRLDSLHRYIELRKKWLNIDELFSYDLSVPVIKGVSQQFSKEEACQLVVDSVAPLGQEYQNILKNGLLEDNWVDFYENEGKRSGAYSSGCFDSDPYILMNFHGNLNDVFTLAHEAGHSMHSYLSRQHQNYQNSDYPIFVAEVASTFNEQLLAKHLMENATEEKEKAYLLNYQIDGLRATLFRQVQFAEFELLLHEFVEKDIPLTPALLKKEYAKINEAYYGDSLSKHPLVAIEWARVPHFYYNFYVYQYATGISAAYTLFERVQNHPETKDDYLAFLSSGGSKYPLELLKIAGADMTKPDAVLTTIDRFDALVKQLDESLSADKICHKS